MLMVSFIRSGVAPFGGTCCSAASRYETSFVPDLSVIFLT